MSEAAVAGLDKQNGATLGRILGRGTVGHAEEGSDGVMRATVRIPEDELVYEPGVLMHAPWGRARAHPDQRRQEHALRGAAEQRRLPSSSGW